MQLIKSQLSLLQVLFTFTYHVDKQFGVKSAVLDDLFIEGLTPFHDIMPILKLFRSDFSVVAIQCNWKLYHFILYNTLR